jgi:hypothetical protein
MEKEDKLENVIDKLSDLDTTCSQTIWSSDVTGGIPQAMLDS